MFSIYTSAFNLIENNFNYIETIENFCSFAEEVIIAVNTSKDETYKNIKNLKFNNLKIIQTDFSYEDPMLDGKIKNAALQQTSEEFKIGLDMDEYIPLWQKNIWKELAYKFRFEIYESIMIPSLNLFRDKNHYFSISRKWYLHKGNLSRGAVNFAIKKDGTIDTNRSDTCELINSDGELTKSKVISNNIEDLRTENYPFVVHTGYVNLQNRLLRNKNFWQKHWLIESGGISPNHKIHNKIEDFNEKYERHNLRI